MTLAEYVVDRLEKLGVTDIFGIPGGVILDFLYTINQSRKITPHLSYNEQAAAFEACGYAQVNHTLGVAYATRGPGFTNLITGITDAYADSIPVLFVTSHGENVAGCKKRFEYEQELDTVSMVKGVTKYATIIDSVDEFWKIDKAIYISMEGRKGPVFLDVSTKIWNMDIKKYIYEKHKEKKNIIEPCLKFTEDKLSESQRPLILVGDGVRQSKSIDELIALLNKWNIPVVSSRCSQDIASCYEYYYGYIGSHGIRYANFIFEKADLVIAIGNRLGFPNSSQSFRKALQNKTIIHIDIDVNEKKDGLDNYYFYEEDLKKIVKRFIYTMPSKNYDGWHKTCNTLKEKLFSTDNNYIVKNLYRKFLHLNKDTVIVCDVGNNEFWVSRAYEMAGITNRVLYSKSFGVLGCGIGKAIGASMKTGKKVLLVIGDQGLQLNIQELQVVAQENLPIEIMVINNNASGMIEDREKQKYNKLIHTTPDSGYSSVDLKNIARVYNLDYVQNNYNDNISCPIINELNVNEYIALNPLLPRGNSMQKMSPYIDEKLYQELDAL